jgi:agmatine deiminase
MDEPFYMPAEWEPHEATWLAWPHDRRDWPGKLSVVPWTFAEMARRLAEGEVVRIMVRSPGQEQSARRVLRRAGADCGRIEFFRIPTDRSWTRDMGPMFVRRGGPRGPLVVADFRFNAWARYDNYEHDDRAAALAAQALGMETIRPERGGRRFVLEGGAIDVNGRGTLLTTAQVMLDNTQQPRNEHLSRDEIEAVLREMLGASNIFYLGDGIAGDDTGGHVDDLCRFANPRTVLIAREDNPADVNYRPLSAAREQLQDLRLEDGGRPEIVELPMPEPVLFGGERLPASYANFYIANAVVLVPTFNDPADRIALGILSELFPGRKVVGIHALDLVLGHGAIHCLTQQQPA